MVESGAEAEITRDLMQQHPEVALLLFLYGSLMLAILFGSLIMWFIAVRRWRRGETLLPVEPWTPRAWGLLDLILLAGLVVVGQTFSIKLWSIVSGVDTEQLRSESDFPLSAMAAGSLSYVAVMLIMVAWLMLRYGVSLSHIGLSGRKLFSNLVIGIAAALLALPIVYIIMAIFSFALHEEYDHPLLDRMAEEGSLGGFFLAAFCAVVAAPITEEFLFRVMLQGWLQSLPWSGRNLRWLVGASRNEESFASHDNETPEIPLTSVVSDSDLQGRDDSSVINAYVPPSNAVGSSNLHHERPSAVNPSRDFDSHSMTPPVLILNPAPAGASGPDRDLSAVTTHRPPLWPVFVSGTLFGLAHWGYGLSFVPLIILGIVLGLLYRARHSIWPSLVVHFVLNFISMMGLGISMLVKALAQ